MANPGGGNQFGNYTLQAPYGDVAEQTRLTKSAPMSGAPYAAHATETPRRSGEQAKRGQRQPGPPAQQQPQGQQQPSQAAILAQTWQELAETPGASETIQQLAYQAVSQAGQTTVHP